MQGDVGIVQQHIMGSWKFVGKSWENIQQMFFKHVLTYTLNRKMIGKPLENHRKPWENGGLPFGKHRQNTMEQMNITTFES